MPHQTLLNEIQVGILMIQVDSFKMLVGLKPMYHLEDFNTMKIVCVTYGS